ncbi:MAG TPA: hypothetical protein VFJ61_08135 [Solirubrobacterales bacterium]|nr:hypothetical protein [Solirubrobacterales bacterium]
MAEQATSTRPDSTAGNSAEVSELRAEVARGREEVLRLRDLLIAKEAELGSLRGRVAEMEGGAAPLVMIAARLRALMPGSLRSLLAKLLRRVSS